MADGCLFHGHIMSAASRILPLGSWIRVRNKRNNRVILVEVRDRGPYIAGRIVDLSRAAAEALGMVTDGIVMVSIEPIGLHTRHDCRG